MYRKIVFIFIVLEAVLVYGDSSEAINMAEPNPAQQRDEPPPGPDSTEESSSSDSSSSTESGPLFRKDYTFNSETENFYKVHTTKKSWVDASSLCNAEGATLFYPESSDVADAIIDLVNGTWPENSKLPEWIWIGIHDEFSEGEYVTVDGQHIEDIFVDWDEGQPDGDIDENCVAMNRPGKMHDMESSSKLPFICMKSLDSVKWNEECDLPDIDYKKHSGSCYKLHLSPRNWQDAFSICRAEQSYLAIANSEAEADYFVRIIDDANNAGVRADYERNALLGFHNRFDGWTTVKGESLEKAGYTRWEKRRKNRDGIRCGGMFFDGGLNDVNCDKSAIFICEHDVKDIDEM